MNIKNKVVIVTGASSGIGYATATLLAKQGAKVALVARSTDKLNKLARKLNDAFPRPTDMTNILAIKKMVDDVIKHYGRIDMLINNAGQGYDASIEQTTLTNLHYIFELDLVGPLVAMQQVIPYMKRKNQGSIINISSGTTLMHLPEMGAYAAIKAALAHLSLTAREELKPFNINVSVVYPYITKTDFEKNTITEDKNEYETNEGNDYQPPKADSAEYIARKIVDCIISSEAECYAHDWMKPKK
jgi:short-subunit dehydrogenase